MFHKGLENVPVLNPGGQIDPSVCQYGVFFLNQLLTSLLLIRTLTHQGR